jgi:hypothetical protein
VILVLTVPASGDGQSLRERMTDIFQPDDSVASVGDLFNHDFGHTWNCELKNQSVELKLIEAVSSGGHERRLPSEAMAVHSRRR